MRPKQIDFTLSDEYYLSSMSPNNTAAQNMTAFSNDIAAALAAGKAIYIPAGNYDWGYTDTTQLTTNLTGTNKLIIRGAGRMTRLLVQNGTTTIPWIITTENAWADYTVSAIATATSGANISTLSEVTKVTISSPPSSIARGEMASVFSNDHLLYTSSPYELNYPHEISEVQALDTADVYLYRKLNRTYTAANYCRLRLYNNRNVVFDIDDITWVADGDIYDTAIASSARPSMIYEVRGIRDGKVGPGHHVESAWAGGPSFNSTMNFDYQGTCDQVINGNSVESVLGYVPRMDGVNLGFRFRNNHNEHGRHLPTSTWTEEGHLTIPTTSFSAGSTTTFGYTSSTASTPAVNDLLYIDVSGVTGTINTMPIGWYTITARTGSASSGTFTVAYNSTGNTFTSGSGDALCFQPDQTRRYGESDGVYLDSPDWAFNDGAPADSHENEINRRVVNGRSRFPGGFTWGTTNCRTFNIRGINETVDGFYQEGGAQFASIASFGANHGQYVSGSYVPIINTVTFKNIHTHIQQDRASGSSYFDVTGGASVTDTRKLIIDGWKVTGGAYALVSNPANSGDVLIKNLHFSGDWGISAPSAYMFDNRSGNMVIEDSIIDLSEVTTPASGQVRIATLITAGSITFRRCTFKGLACTATSSAFVISTAALTMTFEDCTFEYLSTATDNTIRTILVNNVAATVIFRGTTKLVNAAKMAATRGLVCASGASAVGTIIVEGQIVADGAYLLGLGVSSGTVSQTFRNTPVERESVNNTAVGNVAGGEDDLITYALPAYRMSMTGRGVRITAWGTTANNSNPKTVKVYFGSQVVLTTALTISQVGVWRAVAEVWSTGIDTQDYVAQLVQGGTTTLVDVENGTATQNDGAAITIKCTGTVTDGGGGINNNDIVQEGLLVEVI